jgi:hypothetical protein
MSDQAAIPATQSMPNPNPVGQASASPNAKASSNPETRTEFAKSLGEALKDPVVQQGFEAILRPMIVSHVAETLKTFQGKVEDLEIDLSVTKDSVAELDLKTDSINQSLQKRIRDLERQVRSKNLRITGLTPCDDAAPPLHNKYAAAMRRIITETGIEGVTDSDILDYVKINTPNQAGSSVTVLLKMSSEIKRDKLYQQRSKLKNCTTRHYLNEDLTRQDSKIFKRLRGEVKAGSLHSCWTKGGLPWAKATEDGKPFPVHE